MKPTIYALNWAPDFAKGQVRDLRVRWALEEAGIDYQANCMSFSEKAQHDYLARQPFGQVPAYEDEEVQLFESGAIVLHIAEKSDALMPTDPAGKARARMWLIAALSSIEPFIFPYQDIILFNAGEDWAEARKPEAEKRLVDRLGQLAAWLDGKDYLEDCFTAGDLYMMACLRSLDTTDHISGHSILGPYVARGEARPAFKRALAAQMADFTGSPPG
ncbi:MAG: glutathione S-transferase [Ponticaulis sp.]|nr:glutathione S-transferase [Ponticaulis sp.]